MAATSGIATLGRLGDVPEQPARIKPAIDVTAKRVSREHRMKTVPYRVIGELDAHTQPLLYVAIPANCGRFAWCSPVHKTAAATGQGHNPLK
jgi:hypothetical protein